MTRTAPVLCVMLLTALTIGCAKKASSDRSAAPGEADELAMLEQQLTQREGQLQAIGVAVAVPPTARLEKRAGEAADANVSADATITSAGSPPATAPSEAPRPDDPGDRCTRVCEISTAICALEDQICGLLPRHPGEARYQAACERASADCQLATEACHACTGN